MIEPLVRAALLEDLGRAGDITTDAIVPAEAPRRDRAGGAQAGRRRRPRLRADRVPPDRSGDRRAGGTRRTAAGSLPGDLIATISGPARGILTAERTALNFLCHLSGVASATRGVVDAIAGHTARRSSARARPCPDCGRRRNTRCASAAASNHRFGLDDAVLIKDNHVAIAGGIRPAVERARAGVGHMVKIELEVDTLAQLEEALTLRVDAVLLDNMDPEMLRQAVGMVDGPHDHRGLRRHPPGHRGRRSRRAAST